jgi:hypothetical protein
MGGVGVNITEGTGDGCGTESACGDRDSARLAGDVTTLQNGGGGGRDVITWTLGPSMAEGKDAMLRHGQRGGGR